MKLFITQKKHITFIAFCMLILNGITSNAQTIENPGAYITAIGNAQAEMQQKYMAYMSAVAHSRRARKVEKLRMATIESIQNCKYKTTDINIYKGDNSLRKSSIDYIDLCYKVFNEDYKHIVDIEEIAEQSFDDMQAYILLNEKTNQKLADAGDKMSKATNEFARKYNVILQESSNELGDKLNKAGLLNSYHNKVYLLFYKCNWQDNQITEAMNNKKLKEMEQSRNSLIRYATEGLAVLDTLQPFQGDASLKNACKEVITYYKKIAENEIPAQTDFFLKLEEFEKAKKAFESKTDRTQADVDAYNKAVKDINTYSSNFSKTNTMLNNTRGQMAQKWNNAEAEFNDRNMPHYK